MLAILDGTVLPATEATIPATDEGLLRGDGVFEVVRLYGGRAFALDDHLTRLGRSARNLRLEVDGVMRLGAARYRNVLLYPHVKGFRWHPIVTGIYELLDIDNSARRQ